MADTEILRRGSWTERRLSATGAVMVGVLVGGSSAEFEVDGLTARVRLRGDGVGAFPLAAAAGGVTLRAVAPVGTAFPGGSRADVSIELPAISRTLLLQDFDVAGRQRADLVHLVLEDETWVLRAAEDDAAPLAPSAPSGAAASASAGAPPSAAPSSAAPASGGPASAGPASAAPPSSAAIPPSTGSPQGYAPAATTAAAPSSRAETPGGLQARPAGSAGDDSSAGILGRWLSRRLAERSGPVSIGIRRIVVDGSASMRSRTEEADAVSALVAALIEETGRTAPAISTGVVGGAAEQGVGSLDAGAALGADTLIVSDLPPYGSAAPVLLLGEAGVAAQLAGNAAGIHAPSPGVWEHLAEGRTEIHDADLGEFEALVRWLSTTHDQDANR